MAYVRFLAVIGLSVGLAAGAGAQAVTPTLPWHLEQGAVEKAVSGLVEYPDSFLAMAEAFAYFHQDAGNAFRTLVSNAETLNAVDPNGVLAARYWIGPKGLIGQSFEFPTFGVYDALVAKYGKAAPYSIYFSDQATVTVAAWKAGDRVVVWEESSGRQEVTFLSADDYGMLADQLIANREQAIARVE